MTLTARVAERYSHLVHGKTLTPFGGLGVRALHDLDVDYRSSSRYRSDEQYWTEMSEGLPRPVRLADGAGLTSMPQRMMVRTLNPTLAKQLSDVATEWTTSEVAVLVGAFASYLGRMTDSGDVVSACRCPAAPRRRRDVQVGCCPTSCLFVRNSNGICPHENWCVRSRFR